MRSPWPANNLEAQSQVVAAVLSRLLDAGISTTILGAEDFKSTFERAGYPQDFDVDGLFTDIMKWLESEGIIRVVNVVSGTKGESVYDCVITAKGLHLLQEKRDVLGGRTGVEILEANKKGDAAASNYVRAGSFLGGILGGFTKSIS